jgi:hypothetical protein
MSRGDRDEFLPARVVLVTEGASVHLEARPPHLPSVLPSSSPMALNGCNALLHLPVHPRAGAPGNGARHFS